MANALNSSGATSIPDGWQVVRLGDVATMSQGGTPRKDRSEYWDGHIPFVTGADLTKFRIGRRNARSFLTDQGLYSGGTVVCEPGSLLLATRTAVGLASMATETLGASQDITCLVTNGRVDAEYLCRSLVGLASSLKRRSRGTTIQGITREDVTSLHILLPPLTEQWAIATVLDSIDEAIEGTEAVIASTEQLRDSLLHELLARGVPGWHTAWRDMPGLRTIPADWKVVKLGVVAEVITGGTPPRQNEDYYGGYIPWVKPSDLASSRVVSTSDEYLTDEGLSVSRLVPKHSVLVSCIGTLGEVAMAGVPLCFNQQINGLLPSCVVVPSFLYWSLSARADHLRTIASKTAVPILNKQQFSRVLIPLPPLPEQRTISILLDGVDEAIESRRAEREKMIAMKASAADALLTGRVRAS